MDVSLGGIAREQVRGQQGAGFFLVQYTKNKQYPKQPQTIPNINKILKARKTYQMTTRYTKIFHSKFVE
jgi:hypothetical protein